MPTGVPSFPASECRPAARRDSLGTLCWLPTVALERQPCCKFYTSRIADCGGLPERRIRGRSGNCPTRDVKADMLDGRSVPEATVAMLSKIYSSALASRIDW